MAREYTNRQPKKAILSTMGSKLELPGADSRVDR
jgi:hypothetical protein